MKKDIVNPFATSELRIPASLHEEVRKFTDRFTPEEGQDADPDRTPFKRFVDLWWAGLAIGVADERRIESPTDGWHKFTDGVILQSDPWRVTQLQMLGLVWSEDAGKLPEPNKIMARANEYAAHGIEVLLGIMVGKTEPIFHLSEALKDRCVKAAAEQEAAS